jgi:outer membrane protein TolC
MSTLVAALAALTLSQAPVAQPPATPRAAPPAAPAAAGPDLTLDEALQRALEENTDLQVARARLSQAKAGVWKAWSYHLPQVTAGGTWTHNNAQTELNLPIATYLRERTGGPGEPAEPINDLFGRPLPGNPPTNGGAGPSYFLYENRINATLQAYDQLGGQLQVTQAIFAPAAWFGIKAAYAGADLAEWSAETARREVLFGVAQLYYGVTSLKKLVAVAEELQGIAARQERDAKVRLEAGTIAKVAYLRASIDLARADQDLIRARNAYESARLALSVALVRDARFEVVEPPEPPLPADLTHLEEGALQARPDLKAAVSGEAVAANLRRVAVARYLPSLGAFFRYQMANVGGFTGQSDSWAAGLALNWTIFDGGLREAEIKEGSARIAEAEATRRGLEYRITAEVKQAILDLESAQANAVKSKEQARLAEENQRLVDVSFRAGAATAVEQADATAQLRTAAIAATADGLQAQLAAVKLLKVAGIYVQGAGK